MSKTIYRHKRIELFTKKCQVLYLITTHKLECSTSACVEFKMVIFKY